MSLHRISEACSADASAIDCELGCQVSHREVETHRTMDADRRKRRSQTLDELHASAEELRNAKLPPEEKQRQMRLIYSRRKRVKKQHQLEALWKRRDELEGLNAHLRTDNAELHAILLRSKRAVAIQSDASHMLDSIRIIQQARAAIPGDVNSSGAPHSVINDMHCLEHDICSLEAMHAHAFTVAGASSAKVEAMTATKLTLPITTSALQMHILAHVPGSMDGFGLDGAPTHRSRSIGILGGRELAANEHLGTSVMPLAYPILSLSARADAQLSTPAPLESRVTFGELLDARRRYAFETLERLRTTNATIPPGVASNPAMGRLPPRAREKIDPVSSPPVTSLIAALRQRQRHRRFQGL